MEYSRLDAIKQYREKEEDDELLSGSRKRKNALADMSYGSDRDRKIPFRIGEELRAVEYMKSEFEGHDQFNIRNTLVFSAAATALTAAIDEISSCDTNDTSLPSGQAACSLLPGQVACSCSARMNKIASSKSSWLLVQPLQMIKISSF